MENKLLVTPVLLPGDGPIFDCPDGMYIRYMKSQTRMHKHLYLVLDREIKEGDYYIDTLAKHQKVWKMYPEGIDLSLNEMRRIEATTDKSLGLPLIPQSFIEEYVSKQGKINKVYIELENAFEHLSPNDSPIWQVKLDKEDEVIILPVKDSWNREELANAFLAGQHSSLSFDEWFNKNY